ncbi:MAG: hypothetical protein ACOYOS_09685, partial [Syntrophales bacterium]
EMALLAKLPVDGDISFQRFCLLKKFCRSLRLQNVPITHFLRLPGLSGASAGESQGKIESMIQGLFVAVLFFRESDRVGDYFWKYAILIKEKVEISGYPKKLSFELLQPLLKLLIMKPLPSEK